MFQFIPSFKHEIKLNETYMHGNREDGNDSFSSQNMKVTTAEEKTSLDSPTSL